jgi:sugar/nucleoside kinase (ribokinase family)
VDTVDNRSITNEQVDTFAQELRDIKADAVAFCDFRHGIFNHNTTPFLIEAIPNGCFKVADSQVASRWGNILEFGGFDLITPNEKEARFALGDQDAGIRTIAARLYEVVGCKTVILKLGDRGLLTCRGREHDNPRTYFVVDSFARHVVDPVGAGDALLAYATLSLLVDKSEVVASILGSLAAALECEYDGNVHILHEDVHTRLEEIKKLCEPSS